VAANHTWLNAAAETSDPASVWSYFRRLIELRKSEEVIQMGDVRFLDAPTDRVIAYERTLGSTRVVVQCNFSGEEQPALELDGGEILVSNYDEAAQTSTLRPWEGTARIWR
jgi:glycosidase